MQLREYLFHNRITQKSFAEAMDVSPVYLHMLCNGLRTPGARLAYRIEQATDGAVTLKDWQDKEAGTHIKHKKPKAQSATVQD